MAFDAFIKIDGIKGESTDAKHKDEIAVQSFAWGVSNAGSAYATGGAGHGAGKASAASFSVMKAVDKASPDLFLSCATGKHVKDMLVTIRKAGGTALEYLTYKMSDVMVSSYQVSGSAQGDLPSESVSFDYGKIEIKYTPQDAKGAGVSPVGSGYDFATNQKV
jgi:type VI secretion system secreted protein Hcp